MLGKNSFFLYWRKTIKHNSQAIGKAPLVALASAGECKLIKEGVV